MTAEKTMREKFEAAGLVLPGGILADGRLHRCAVTDRGNGRDGAYVAHMDEHAGCWWMNWRTGATGTWSARAEQEMSPAER